MTTLILLLLTLQFLSLHATVPYSAGLVIVQFSSSTSSVGACPGKLHNINYLVDFPETSSYFKFGEVTEMATLISNQNIYFQSLLTYAPDLQPTLPY